MKSYPFMSFRIAMTLFRNGFIYLGLLLWVGGIVSLLPACSRTADHEQIASLITKGAALAEAHDISGLLDLTTDDFRAMPMDLDRRGMKGVLWRTFNYYGPLDILYPRPEIDIQENTQEAFARFPLLIVKKERTIPGLDKLRDDPKAWIDAVSDIADLYRLRLQLAKQGGSWLVTRAVLERFAGLGFE